MKQLIEDLISAMEYHVEQTRPIHSTTVALQAAREALKAMPTPLVCDCNQGQVCHVCDPITPPEQPTPVPASWMEMVTANLVREGVNKHKARELAEHFYGLAPAAQHQCKWPTCQSEEYQQALAEQINQELVTGAAQPAPVANGRGEHMKTTIEMAREAGLEITVDPTETPWRTFVEGWEDQLKAFEALVRADEREACAKVCDDLHPDWKWRAAESIRARGNT
jgi:hypothetical protein